MYRGLGKERAYLLHIGLGKELALDRTRFAYYELVSLLGNYTDAVLSTLKRLLAILSLSIVGTFSHS